MKWTGFDRNDPNQKKFTFDDGAMLMTNPPQYSVTYESGDVGYINCEDVFKLKPIREKRNTQPVVKQENSVVIEQSVPDMYPESIKDDVALQMEIENELRPKRQKKETPMVKTEAPKKKKTTRKKTDVVVTTTENTEEIQQMMTAIPLNNHKYEYKAILGDFEDLVALEEKLNILGEDGWDMINFKVVQSLFPNKSRLFCILKRNKIN